MITYTDFGHFICAGDPNAGGEQIPKSEKCGAYKHALAEVAAGRAEIVAYEKPGSPAAADKEAAHAAIDAAAEAARCRFITPGSGQAMVYLEKRAEARRFIDDQGVGDYPLLDASVGVEGADRGAVAALVLATAEAWTPLGATIERMRLAGKRAVTVATTWAQLAEAQSIAWPTPG